jgi:hypothetical protein
LDYKIRTYKERVDEWKWVLKTTQDALDLKFTFDYHVDKNHLAKYLKVTLFDDWKKIKK